MYQLGQLFIFPAAKNETLILFKNESYITLLLFHSIEKSVFFDIYHLWLMAIKISVTNNAGNLKTKITYNRSFYVTLFITMYLDTGDLVH